MDGLQVEQALVRQRFEALHGGTDDVITSAL